MGFRHKRVQRVRRLLNQSSYRRSERAFVVEGPQLVDEAVRAGAELEGVYVAPEGMVDPVVERAGNAGIRVFPLGRGVIERVSDTASAQPVLAVAPMPAASLDGLHDAGFVVVCVDVRDPGNLGTVLRTAEAAGVDGVICTEGTVDAYNPKSVRASAGSVFNVTVVAGGEPVEVLEKLGAWGMRRLGTSSGGGTPYFGVDFTGRIAVVLGNEAHGLAGPAADQVDEWTTIPMVGRAESLNVGMAAAVLCFEAARQRGS
ncbi:MAG: TrmH family RNA methyltransferase [Acidimicrobiales bacterium]